jgi:arginyl-tRNA synthetase
MSRVLHQILQQRENYGHYSATGSHQVLFDLVSARPVAPLNLCQGRAAAYGMGLQYLYTAAGHQTRREYFLSEQHESLPVLAASVWLRYLDLCGVVLELPACGHEGDFVWDIAASLHRQHQEAFLPSSPPGNISPDITAEKFVSLCESAIGRKNFDRVLKQGLDEIVNNIQLDLKEFGLEFNRWLSSQALAELVRQDIDEIIIVRCVSDLDNSQQLLDELKQLGMEASQVHIIGIQPVQLTRKNQPLVMNAAAEDFYSFRQFHRQLGNELVYFNLLQYDPEHDVTLSIEQLQSEANYSPVKTIAQIQTSLAERELTKTSSQTIDVNDANNFDSLDAYNSLPLDIERELINSLGEFPHLVESATRWHKPHQLACFLRDLANDYVEYSEIHAINAKEDAITGKADDNIWNARYCLDLAVKQVLENGLTLLGVDVTANKEKH